MGPVGRSSRRWWCLCGPWGCGREQPGQAIYKAETAFAAEGCQIYALVVDVIVSLQYTMGILAASC